MKPFRFTIALSLSPQSQSSWKQSFSRWGVTRNTNRQTWGHLPLISSSLSTVEGAIKHLVAFTQTLPTSPLSVQFSSPVSKDQSVLAAAQTGDVAQLQKKVAGVFGVSEKEYSPLHFCLYEGVEASAVSALVATSPAPFSLEFDGLEVIVHYPEENSVGKVRFGTKAFLRNAMFINGKWIQPKKQLLPVFNPYDTSVLNFVPAGTAADVDAAVHAARNAFPIWSQYPAEKRAAFLVAIADEISSRVAELTILESLDNGKPLAEAKMDVDDTAACFRYYAQQILDLEKTSQDKKIDVGDDGFHVSVRYEAVGVCGLIIPWNYPLLMAAWKIAPCLAAGCTFVLKPSELTPFSAIELAGICDQVGLPPGVVNLVTGYGPDAGAPLAEHPGVDKVAFTGSVPTGSKIMEVGAKSVKKVTLELGGKSPIIVCKDADIEQAVDWVTCGVFFNAGQVCSATSRLIVHKDIHNELISKIKQVALSIKLGCGQDESSKMGPLVSKGQHEKVLGYIYSGLEEGATLVCGGAPTDPALKKGYFVTPTVFTDVKPHMKIWREEIFGPVLSVMSFTTEEEAVHLANDTTFGLGAAVVSKNSETCERIAKQFQAGIVWINCSQPTLVQAPWGGVKKSGTGRELGPWGLHNYLEVKQVTRWVNQTAKGWSWFTSKL